MAETSSTDARMTRGLTISETKSITENQDGSFRVSSQTNENLTYEVKVLESRWVCTCPDFEYREIEACKHIYAVKFWIVTNSYFQDKAKPKVFSEDAVPCDRCGSIRVMRYGRYGEKQIFKCKDCGHKFREQNLLKKAKYDAELITITLDLYFKGVSLRKISDHLSQMYGIELNFSTIYNWIKRYIPMISDYVNTLTPKLSDSWHADELFVPLKNGDSIKAGSKVGYVWNLMDRRTRFLIASKLADKRGFPEALQAFKEALENAYGQSPKTVFTDMWRPYIQATKSLGESVEHKRVGIRVNNRIERLNGTLKERTKVQRGLKTVATPIPEGQRINYNFIKPHQALQGQTPAQKAGIDIITSRNKWMNLLELATNGDYKHA